MPAGGLVTAGVIGAAKIGVGLINKSKANKKAAELERNRPKYAESKYAQEGLRLAESELSTGMSGEAKNAYEQGNDRALSTSLDAILKGGGSSNNVAQVFDASQQGRQRLALMKENLRLNQINNVVRAQQFSEDEREKAFKFNQYAPWADQSQATAQARTGAEGQIWEGVNTAGSAIMRGFDASAAKKQQNSFFQGNQPNTSQDRNFSPVERADTGGGGRPSPAGNYGFLNPNTTNPMESFPDPQSYSMPDMSNQE